MWVDTLVGTAIDIHRPDVPWPVVVAYAEQYFSKGAAVSAGGKGPTVD